MTLIAGVYARRPGEDLAEDLCDRVSAALSRHPGEKTTYFRDTQCFIVKADIGAFGDEAAIIDANAASFLTGELILDHGSADRRPRQQDLREVHESFLRGDDAPLRRARGVFSGAHYDRGRRTISLFTDKVGVRPIYYSVGERYVFFGSAIRILESLAEVPKELDLLGVTEISTLGYPLAERTALAAVSVLKAGEVLTVGEERSSRKFYWRWDNVEQSDRPLDDLAREAHAEFIDGVRLRIGTDTTTAAFLSGGLDSRSVVTALHTLGIKVHTFNFSVPGLQDQAFGAEYARQLGTLHVEKPNVPGRAVTAVTIAEAWASSPYRSEYPAERPNLVWSGDGGSVSLGFIYLTAPMVDLPRHGKVREAADLMTEVLGAKVSPRLLHPAALAEVAGCPASGLRAEFEALHCRDAGRKLHLVLMHNDQRRHQTEHFETIDLHRTELQLPLFDSQLLAAIMRVPFNECLGHKFYMRWLRFFPPVALSVPWQAYPGHEPCPLPIPPGLVYQWGREASKKVRNATRRDLFRAAMQMLRSPYFPDDILRRNHLRLAAWLYRLRIRDLSYVVRGAQPYFEYASRYRRLPPKRAGISRAQQRR